MPISLKLDPGCSTCRSPTGWSLCIPATWAGRGQCRRQPGRLGPLAADRGGTRCQYYYREIVERVLTAAGVGMLPEAAFTTAPFATDWLDTAESQRLLHYKSAIWAITSRRW